MTARPSLPEWEPPDGNVVEPSGGQKSSGWQGGQEPPAQHFNWFWRGTSRTMRHNDEHAVRAYSSFDGVELNPGVGTDPQDIAEGLGAKGRIYVALGVTGGTIWTSYDLISWTEQTNPAAPATLASIAWSPLLQLFVAVGQADGGDAVIVTSPDGETWTERANPQNAGLNDVVWCGSLSLFVAVGSNYGGASCYVVSSADGTTWTDRSVAQNVTMQRVIFDDTLELFLAVGDDGYWLSSADGTTWTATAWDAPVTPFYSIFRVGARVYVVNEASFRYTTNGTTWTADADHGMPSLAYAEAFGDVVLVSFNSGLLDGNPSVFIRDSGADWTDSITDLVPLDLFQVYSMRRSGRRWFLLGDLLYYSPQDRP